MNRLYDYDLEEEQRRIELHEKGYTDGQAAKALGMKYRVYYGWRVSRGLPQNKETGDTRLREAGMSRMDIPNLIAEIRGMGVSQKELTYELGVSWAALYYWYTNTSVPHDPGFVRDMLKDVKKKYERGE